MLRLVLLAVLVLIVVRVVKAALRAMPAQGVGSAPPPPRRDRDPHDVLGVARGASEAEIRAAYQQKMRENHPDRVADMSREIRDLAEERTKEINAAYYKLRVR